jgi:hypothetical protein
VRGVGEDPEGEGAQADSGDPDEGVQRPRDTHHEEKLPKVTRFRGPRNLDHEHVTLPRDTPRRKAAPQSG